MAILVNAAESGLMEPSHANVIKKFAQNLSMWLRERAVQGAALFSSLYADIKAYDYVVLVRLTDFTTLYLWCGRVNTVTLEVFIGTSFADSLAPFSSSGFFETQAYSWNLL